MPILIQRLGHTQYTISPTFKDWHQNITYQKGYVLYGHLFVLIASFWVSNSVWNSCKSQFSDSIYITCDTDKMDHMKPIIRPKEEWLTIVDRHMDKLHSRYTPYPKALSQSNIKHPKITLVLINSGSPVPPTKIQIRLHVFAITT